MPKKAQASLQGMSAVIYARYSSHGQNDASIVSKLECDAHPLMYMHQANLTSAQKRGNIFLY